ncbi:MAG: amidohydrolase family protein [Parvularculaceae bacterium]
MICARTIFAAAVLALTAAAATAQPVLIRNARVHTMSAAGVIENGDVLLNDGVVVQVGVEVAPPAGATVIEAAGKVVTPGIFAAYSTLGLEELSLDGEANDASTRDNFPLSASLDATDAFNNTSSLIAINRAGGVTRALTTPEPGSKIFGGRAAVVDLSGRIASVTLAGAAQNAVLGYQGATRTGDSRLGAFAVIREYFDEAKAYAANPRDYKSRARDNDMTFADLEALIPVVEGRQPILLAADSAVDLRGIIRLKTDYNINVIVLGGTEAWRVAGELAATNIPVIMDPAANLPGSFEDLGSTLANAARLQKAGVRIAFFNPDGGTTHNLRLLTQQAGNAVAHGLPYEAALAAITINPAAIYGLSGRLGSLEPGKAGDVVIWDGDPLEVTTRAVAVFIDGRAMSMQNRQTRMRERYKNLERGDLPFAYRGQD